MPCALRLTRLPCYRQVSPSNMARFSGVRTENLFVAPVDRPFAHLCLRMSLRPFDHHADYVGSTFDRRLRSRTGVPSVGSAAERVG